MAIAHSRVFCNRLRLVVFLLLGQSVAAQAEAQEPIVFPKETNPSIGRMSVQEFARQWQAGSQREIKAARRTLKKAKPWIAKPDTYWLERVLPVTPRGMWSVACPIHPFHVLDFAIKFDWDIERPWQLICPLCEKEGRPYPYYPNPDFPDDGTGCQPSDAIWKKHHGADWSRRNGNIPWDHWDGKTHGSCESHAYFFRGKWAHLCMYEIAREILPQLTQAYLVGRCCHAEGSTERETADRAARTTKVILLTYARAFLGDPYLAAVMGISESAHLERLQRFYQVPAHTIGWFQGYLPYTIMRDHLYTDDEFPRDGGRNDMFGDGSQYARANQHNWLRALTEIRSSFKPDEETTLLPYLIRLLSVQPGDEERIRQHPDKPRLRYGILNYISPPNRMGTRGNLNGMPFTIHFELARLLGNSEYMEALLDNISYFMHNYFRGDGLGEEGSPHYTNVGMNTFQRFVERFAGYRAGYDESHPMWDPQLGGLNPYRLEAYADTAWKQALTVLPNGRKVAWEDSVVCAQPRLAALQEALDAGHQIPESYAQWYAWENRQGERIATGVLTDRLRSWVFHHSRKVLLRAGKGDSASVASLNFSWDVGHWHYSCQDLMLFAEGHEMLSDLGYLGSSAPLTKEWIRRAESHQTVIVRDATGSNKPSRVQRGELIGFASDVLLGYAETCELGAAQLERLGSQGHYGRAIFLVPLPQGGQYVFDVARVRGGVWHEWYAHFGQEDVTVGGAELTQTGNNLAQALAIQSEAAKVAPSRIQHVSTGVTDSAVTVDALRCVTWDRDFTRHVDDHAGIRTTVLAAPGTQVFLGDAPGQRVIKPCDFDARLRVLCLRRPATSALDGFIAVHEPFRNRPKILQVAQADMKPDREGVIATVVKHETGTDWLLCGPSTLDRVYPSHVARFDGQRVEWAGQAAFVRFDTNGHPQAARLFGPGFVSAGTLSVQGTVSWRARLVEFDDDADTLDVTADAAPSDLHRAALVLFVRHENGTSTYSLQSIVSTGDGRYRIHLAHKPHLAINRLRVNRTHEGGIIVEPPPDPPRSAGMPDLQHLGLQVYSIVEAHHRWLGTLVEKGSLTKIDAFGQQFFFDGAESTIELTRASPKLSPRTKLDVTRLQPGRDIVLIPTWTVSR